MRLPLLAVVAVAAMVVDVSGEPTPTRATFPTSEPGLGIFGKLASLQCALPDAGDGGRPPSARRLSALRAHRPTPMSQPRPSDVCQPPTYAQVFMGAKERDLTHALPYDRHAWKVWMGSLRRGPLQPGPILLSKRVYHKGEHGHDKAQWLPDASIFKGDALLHERDVASRLTLLRNSFSGSVQRVTGKYDVLSVSRLSAGVCLTRECHDVAAVDVASSTLDDFAGNQVPVLTAPVGKQDGGPLAPVGMQDKDMLSLGRSVLADPAWLGNATGLWRVRARVSLSAACHADGSLKRDKVPDQLRNKKHEWTLGNANAQPASHWWLQAIASVACRTPTWLIRHADLCDTAGAAQDFEEQQQWRPDVYSAVKRKCGVTWYIRPPAATDGTDGASPPPPGGCPSSLKRSELPYRPPWLPGLGAREINPSSASEGALATRMVSCIVDAVAGAPFWHTRLGKGGWPESYTALQGIREDLSHHFESSIFNVDPPPDRAEAIDIVLSLIVLLPEAAALAVQSCLPPGRFSMAAMVATFFVGLVSLSGVGMLAILEVTGSRFHATADLEWLAAHVTPAVAQTMSVNRNLTGSPLVRSETLLLISAVGYRPWLLVGLAVGSALLYLVVSAAAFMTAASIGRRARLAEVDPEQHGPRGWSAASSVQSDETIFLVRDDRPSPTQLVAKWGLMGGPGGKCLSLWRFITLADPRVGSPMAAVTPSSAPPMAVPWLSER